MAIITIYKITNRLNNKPYVGQTRQPIEKRFIQHSKADSPLGAAMRHCGLENFTIEVIETCETQEQANERERFWIRVLNTKVPNSYNRSNGGEAGHIKTKFKHVSCPTGKITIGDKIKRVAAYRGYNLKTLGEEFNQRFGTKYVQQSFSKKINDGAIRYDELEQFGDILGFKVKLELDG